MTLPHWFSSVAFALAFVLLIVLPFLPAWREWCTPTDAAALPVPDEPMNDDAFFSARFRIASLMEIAAKRLVPHAGFEYARKPASQIDWSGTNDPLIVLSKMSLADDIDCGRPIFVKQNFEGGSDNRFTSILAEGSMILGNRTLIRQWAHADGLLRLAAHSIVLKRISSATLIELGLQCCFRRVNAPVIHFGLLAQRHEPDATPTTLVVAEFIDLPNASQRTGSVFFVNGDCVLRAGRIYYGSLIVTGKLWIGPNTTVTGDIKAREGIIIGPHARALGSVVCEKIIEIQGGAHAAGPVVSETDVLLGRDCKLGSIGRATSVTAQNIVASAGAVAHGTVWARETGVVIAT